MLNGGCSAKKAILKMREVSMIVVKIMYKNFSGSCEQTIKVIGKMIKR